MAALLVSFICSIFVLLLEVGHNVRAFFWFDSFYVRVSTMTAT